MTSGACGPFVLLLALSCLASAGLANLTRSARAIDGTYKYLIFPQGSNVQLVYCLTLATYTKPQGFFTFGVTAGLAYELPCRKSVPYRKPAEVYHRRSRRELYRKVELMLKTRQGKNGRDCVLKALCQAGRRNRNATTTRGPFLQELLHSLFTFPPHDDDDDDDVDEGRSAEYDRAYSTELDCDSLFASCPAIFSPNLHSSP